MVHALGRASAFKILAAIIAITMMLSGMAGLIDQVHASDAEVINFPDANLKHALIREGLDLNGDGQITKGEMAARGLNGTPTKIELGNSGISDLSGLEYAVNVTGLGIGPQSN